MHAGYHVSFAWINNLGIEVLILLTSPLIPSFKYIRTWISIFRFNELK